MNKERLLRAAKILREHAKPYDCDNDSGFRMATYANMCGTPACVLGHVAKFDPDAPFELGAGFILRKDNGVAVDYNGATVCAYYGIDNRQAAELFGASGCGHACHDPIKAAEYIEAFVARGGK